MKIIDTQFMSIFILLLKIVIDENFPSGKLRKPSLEKVELFRTKKKLLMMKNCLKAAMTWVMEAKLNQFRKLKEGIWS